MQNRYAGDVGDFGKLGMLRVLARERPDLRLGLNWYLVPDEDHNDDGKHIAYLEKDKDLCACDEPLAEALRNVIAKGERNVVALEGSVPLSGATYFNDRLVYQRLAKQLNTQERDKWFVESLEVLKNCDLVFLDPDNGLEVKSCRLHTLKGNKYTAYDEVCRYFESGKSVVVYNHRDRKPEEEYRQRFRVFREMLPVDDLFMLRFFRYSVRDYVFLLRPEHRERVRSTMQKFVENSWGKHCAFHSL